MEFHRHRSLIKTSPALNHAVCTHADSPRQLSLSGIEAVEVNLGGQSVSVFSALIFLKVFNICSFFLELQVLL